MLRSHFKPKPITSGRLSIKLQVQPRCACNPGCWVRPWVFFAATLWTVCVVSYTSSPCSANLILIQNERCNILKITSYWNTIAGISSAQLALRTPSLLGNLLILEKFVQDNNNNNKNEQHTRTCNGLICSILLKCHLSETPSASQAIPRQADQLDPVQYRPGPQASMQFWFGI